MECVPPTAPAHAASRGSRVARKRRLTASQARGRTLARTRTRTRTRARARARTRTRARARARARAHARAYGCSPLVARRDRAEEDDLPIA